MVQNLGHFLLFELYLTVVLFTLQVLVHEDILHLVAGQFHLRQRPDETSELARLVDSVLAQDLIAKELHQIVSFDQLVTQNFVQLTHLWIGCCIVATNYIDGVECGCQQHSHMIRQSEQVGEVKCRVNFWYLYVKVVIDV